MEISINTHSSIKLSGQKTVYADPFGITDEKHDADIILITHSHFDHFSPEDIEKIKKEETVLVLPLSCAGDCEKSGIKAENTVFMRAGEKKEICGVEIAAFPAYNKNKPFHPAVNGWLGFVVNTDGERVYIAGDTDALSENENIVCDTAIVPVGGKYTMDFREAAGFINRLSPKKAIPSHYGSIAGNKEDGKSFAALIDGKISVDIII